jgi:hypothetical protein
MPTDLSRPDDIVDVDHSKVQLELCKCMKAGQLPMFVVCMQWLARLPAAICSTWIQGVHASARLGCVVRVYQWCRQQAVLCLVDGYGQQVALHWASMRGFSEADAAAAG